MTTARIHRLATVATGGALSRLPFSLRVLLENLLRHEDGRVVTREDTLAVLAWDAKASPTKEIAFHPGRVLLQDFTGVPAVVDLAAMREAVTRMGGDPERVNPLQSADLVIDHSVQVDHFGATNAAQLNVMLEYRRNRERYAFLRWGQAAFENFRVVPPGTGICHQVNLEYLASVVMLDGQGVAYPDTLVGTDSHTTMINGLGVLGWGVGGIEAEAAMLGQPLSMLLPQVVGFKLTGSMCEGATATDVVLTVTEMLRKENVVGKFVEFFGPGLDALSLPDRATVANMAPEYGATIGFFPVDRETLAYLAFTGRPKSVVDRVEAYCKEQGLFRGPDTPDAEFSDVLELDLGSVEPSLAGPRRPQDRVALGAMKRVYRRSLYDMLGRDFGHLDPTRAARWMNEGGSSDVPSGEIVAAHAAHLGKLADSVEVQHGGQRFDVRHGAVVIAAITSCTNTSNPAVMLAAGLLAKNAVERGLTVKPWVKTSLAPGSKVVMDYLARAGLTPYLEELGFHLVGFGCTTCIGNSGPLPEPIAAAIEEGDLVVASVLSGNRNFEGRINAHVRMNYLASPPLVVAYALRGDVDADLQIDPLGKDDRGEPVYLRDVWPSSSDVNAAIRDAVHPEQFSRQYAHVFDGDAAWRELPVPAGKTFSWDAASTYVKKPPFFDDIAPEPSPPRDISGARVLAVFGDSVTTDHISPAGSIAEGSPAGRYLVEQGVDPSEFNSYGARRGNHEVMVRGTFANIRIKNLMLPGVEGGLTRHLPSGNQCTIYDAAMRYAAEGVPLVVIAGAEYGTGSSRDWAAKGTMLLGVRAVLAKSFERIHRSNLVGMGVLPLELDPGELALTGEEIIEITGVAEGMSPKKRLSVSATGPDGATKRFEVTARIDTPNELDYYLHGGILKFVLRQLVAR
jgi:aconitate hydratase